MRHLNPVSGPLSGSLVAGALTLLLAAGCDSGTSTPATSTSADAAATAQDVNLAAEVAATPGDSDGAAGTFVPGDPPKGLVAVGIGQSGDLAVEVFAPKALTMGQNRLAYRITRAGQSVTAAAVLQKPGMDMDGAPHGCPIMDPGETADSNGLFQGLAVLHMASTAGNLWHLNLSVGAPLGQALQEVFIADLDVTTSTWVKTLKTSAGAVYIVSLYFAAKPKVGLNPYILSIHEDLADSDEFPPVTDATLKATPLMISMGHGSSGNVAPKGSGDGLYSGKVSLSMPGEWQLSFAISAGGKSLGTAAFKLNP